MGTKMIGASASPDRISPKGGRRSGIERREFSFTVYVPERRSGEDRRQNNDRRQKSRILPESESDTNESAKNN